MKASAPEAYGRELDLETTALMRSVKGGDPGAHDRLVRLVRSRAFAVARSLVGSREDAMDLCQEAFLKTYRARATFRDEERFLPWFHRILRNACYSHLRKHGRLRERSISSASETDEPDYEIADEPPSPSLGLERAEAVCAFQQGLRELAARDREILALRHAQELSYKAIASELGIPEGTVMSRLFHARRRLRAAMERRLGKGWAEDVDLRGAP
jgi:RNA polymerase sigma-70 factor (ECF subfamily)